MDELAYSLAMEVLQSELYRDPSRPEVKELVDKILAATNYGRKLYGGI